MEEVAKLVLALFLAAMALVAGLEAGYTMNDMHMPVPVGLVAIVLAWAIFAIPALLLLE